MVACVTVPPFLKTVKINLIPWGIIGGIVERVLEGGVGGERGDAFSNGASWGVTPPSRLRNAASRLVAFGACCRSYAARCASICSSASSHNSASLPLMAGAVPSIAYCSMAVNSLPFSASDSFLVRFSQVVDTLSVFMD